MLVAALTACQMPAGRPGPPAPAPTPPASAPVRLGTVTATAPTVTVNNHPVQGTVVLHDGDKVTTSASGRAHVEITGRGIADIEPGTDPWFVREGACVVVRIIFGKAFVDGTGLCVEDDAGTRVALNSAVHVEVAQGRTRITVLEGTVELQRIARVPTQETLASLERITVARGRIEQRVVVPRSEVDLLRQRLPAVPRQRAPAAR
jgi:hypothetical protein